MLLIEAAHATDGSATSRNAPAQISRSAIAGNIGTQMIHHALGTFIALVGVGISVVMGLLWKGGDKDKNTVTEAFLLGMILVALGAIFDRLSDISYMLVGH